MVCTVTAILHKTLNDYNIDSLCLNHGNLAIHVIITLNEPHREKTGFLPRRKQRRRSASR